MSNDEKMAIVGRMTTERAEARRTLALLFRKIKDAGDALYNGAPFLMREYPSDEEYKKALAMIDRLQGQGGLEGISSALSEYLEIKQRIESLTRSLHDAGAE